MASIGEYFRYPANRGTNRVHPLADNAGGLQIFWGSSKYFGDPVECIRMHNEKTPAGRMTDEGINKENSLSDLLDLKDRFDCLIECIQYLILNIDDSR